MAASQRSPLKTRVVKDQETPSLVLFGNNSILQSKQPDPDITDYAGPLYLHSFHSEIKHRISPDGGNYTSSLYHLDNSMAENSDLQHLQQTSSRNGFFNPRSRPPSGKKSRADSSLTSHMEGVIARPNSVVSTGRPLSAVSRPQSGLGRPSSASRPVSANRPYSRSGERSNNEDTAVLDDDYK